MNNGERSPYGGTIAIMAAVANRPARPPRGASAIATKGEGIFGRGRRADAGTHNRRSPNMDSGFAAPCLGALSLRIRDFALLRSVQRDFLRFFLIHHRQFIACLAFDPEKLVELGVDGLRIPIFGALDE
jgi:hypothetical protein